MHGPHHTTPFTGRIYIFYLLQQNMSIADVICGGPFRQSFLGARSHCQLRGSGSGYGGRMAFGMQQAHSREGIAGQTRTVDSHWQHQPRTLSLTSEGWNPNGPLKSHPVPGTRAKQNSGVDHILFQVVRHSPARPLLLTEAQGAGERVLCPWKPPPTPRSGSGTSDVLSKLLNTVACWHSPFHRYYQTF